jgi:hypothetical protein
MRAQNTDKFISDAQGMGLKAEAEQTPVAIEGVPRIEYR